MPHLTPETKLQDDSGLCCWLPSERWGRSISQYCQLSQTYKYVTYVWPMSELKIQASLFGRCFGDDYGMNGCPSRVLVVTRTYAVQYLEQSMATHHSAKESTKSHCSCVCLLCLRVLSYDSVDRAIQSADQMKCVSFRSRNPKYFRQPGSPEGGGALSRREWTKVPVSQIKIGNTPQTTTKHSICLYV